MNSRDREILERCLHQFKLISRFAQSTGTIKMNGKPISLKNALLVECNAAILNLSDHLDPEVTP